VSCTPVSLRHIAAQARGVFLKHGHTGVGAAPVGMASATSLADDVDYSRPIGAVRASRAWWGDSA
jgi:hypothetical protein